MRVTDFVVGKVTLCSATKNSAKIADICMRHAIPYRCPRFADGNFLIECDIGSSKRLAELCSGRGIELSVKRRVGFPVFFERYKSRVGIFMGVLAAFCILAAAFNTVWRIDVSGNEKISHGQVEILLRQNGFGIGSAISKTDFTLLENRVMNVSDDIAWISVNMDGTVACIEIREKKKESAGKVGATSLVASNDGTIERVEAYSGSCAVKVGDVVRKGDLLVSGEYINDKGESRFTKAEGEIYARTVKSFLVEIPLKTEEKSYTGRKRSDIYVNFFEKTIKIFSNSGKKYSSCDIICKNGEVELFGRGNLPVGYSVNEYLEYKMLPVELDEKEAMEMAFSQLEIELDKLSREIELLRKNIEFEIADGVYILKCELICIENIAEAAE